MLLLGIETSCDDTATAVVRDGRDVLVECRDESGRVPRQIRRHRPRDRQPASRRAALRGRRRRARARGHDARRNRRHRRHRRTGADRKPRRGRCRRQSARLCIEQTTIRREPFARTRLCAVPRSPGEAALSLSRVARLRRPLATRRRRLASAHAHPRTHARRRRGRSLRQNRASARLALSRRPRARPARSHGKSEGLCISSLSPRRRRARLLVLRFENVGALFSRIRKPVARPRLPTSPRRFKPRWSMP